MFVFCWHWHIYNFYIIIKYPILMHGAYFIMCNEFLKCFLGCCIIEIISPRKWYQAMWYPYIIIVKWRMLILMQAKHPLRFNIRKHWFVRSCLLYLESLASRINYPMYLSIMVPSWSETIFSTSVFSSKDLTCICMGSSWSYSWVYSSKLGISVPILLLIRQA